MRVLFVTQVVDRADDNLGAVHGWIAALAREVEALHVIALRTGEVVLPPNVRVYSLGKDKGNGKLHQLRLFTRIAGTLTGRHEVDVSFAHMVPRYALLLAPFRLLFGVPSVMWYAHNTLDLRLRLASLVVDQFLTVSRDSFPLPRARCEVVGHGVDTDLFKPDSSRVRSGKTRFLSLARISPRKDQDTLVSAAGMLVNRSGRQDLEFIIAGGPLVPEDRAYLARLRARVHDLGLDKHFRFTGPVPHSQAAHLIQACDFFVNLHVEGGLGKAVLEAMSCAKPALVATPTYYEAFPEYGMRFLYAPRDAADLARKILDALGMDSGERERVGVDLRNWVVEQHDVRRQMSRIARILTSVARKET